MAASNPERTFSPGLDQVDRRIAGWMAHWGPLLLRVSLAIVFLWFGLLKPLGRSTANELVARTVYWVDPAWFIPFLGWWEVAIGICLLIRPLLRAALLLLFLQMPGTLLPLFMLPEVCFIQVPWVPSLEGQYIIKNLVLISAAIVVGGTVRKRSPVRSDLSPDRLTREPNRSAETAVESADRVNDALEETRGFWNHVADDWRIQVGAEGDRNRLLNSDPVLWRFAGQLRGLSVLDAGCGTGYLSKKLHDAGAHVVGIDFAERMIQIARRDYPGLDFRVDSCSSLVSLRNGSFDLIIANYVLMDTPDLQGTLNAFHRVLKAEGRAIVVFSHPCFPQGRAKKVTPDGTWAYFWSFPYFEPRKCVDSPWAHFKTAFIWFHRSLSDYWKAFAAAGFDVVDFEEPRMTDQGDLADPNDEPGLKYRTRPYSVAFRLQKRSTTE